ncbi:MAG: hypothetical protein GQ581_08325 [Methyloprofundus sp.]|nr:hypothetical protein [Methyloprofundus sp.]
MYYEFKAPSLLTVSRFSFGNIIEVTDWLDNITPLDNSYYFQEMLAALQALRTFKLANKNYFVALEKINEQLTHSVKHFDHDHFEYRFPLSDKQIAKIEMITWVYAELSHNYYRLAMQLIKQKTFLSSKKRPALLLCRSLQASSQAYLKIAGCYALPFQGFWASLYQLYFLAEAQSLLDVSVAVESKENSSVEQLFKQILLLNLCDTHQFRPRDLQKLYDFLGDFTRHSKINSVPNSKYTKHTHLFAAQKDVPPLPLETMKARQSSVNYRYLILTGAVNEIFSQRVLLKSQVSNLNTLNQIMFLRAYKALTFAQKRQHTRTDRSRVGNGVIGLADVIKFHVNNGRGPQNITESHIEGKSKFNALRSRKKQGKQLDLVKKGSENMDILIHDRKADSSHSSAFLNEHTISIDRRKSLRLEEFEVVNSSFNGYQILWDNISKKVQIGNVFGIISELEDAIEVGLVRHMRATEDGLIIGIELLSYESQIIYAFSPNATEQKTKCVLVNQDSVLFSSNHFRTGDDVKLIINNRTISCRLGQSLHLTSSVSHFKLLESEVALVN